MQSIFGTDGIRGRFNEEITYSLAYKVGYALGSSLKNNKLVNKIIAIFKVINEFPKIKLIGIRKKAIFSKKSFTLLLLKIIKRY